MATRSASMEINLGYTRDRSSRAFHARKQRWSCLVVHRRGGKTVACVMDLIDAALTLQETETDASPISHQHTRRQKTLRGNI